MTVKSVKHVFYAINNSDANQMLINRLLLTYGTKMVSPQIITYWLSLKLNTFLYSFSFIAKKYKIIYLATTLLLLCWICLNLLITRVSIKSDESEHPQVSGHCGNI